MVKAVLILWVCLFFQIFIVFNSRKQNMKLPAHFTSTFVSALRLIIEDLSILFCLKEHLVLVNSSASHEIHVYEVSNFHLQGASPSFPRRGSISWTSFDFSAPSCSWKLKEQMKETRLHPLLTCGKTLHLHAKTSARISPERVSAVRVWSLGFGFFFHLQELTSYPICVRTLLSGE